MSAARVRPIRRNWVSTTLAGTLLGLPLALACSGLFVQFNPGMAMSVKGQLAMWMVMPIWLGTLASVYLFRSAGRAWLWLGGAVLVTFGALSLARLFATGG